MNKKEVKISNLAKLYTILLLLDAPRHGYEIIKTVSEKLNKKISAGEIYPFLKLLKRNNYLEIKIIEKRKKKVYSLTKKGKIFARKMLDRFGSLIDIAIKPKLTICANCGCKIYEGGYEEIIKGKKLVFCCIHCAKAYKKWES
jgi:DNA-binding PadR family transcriptional regulator